MQKRKRIASVVTVMVLTTMGALASVAPAAPATASNTSCTLTTASPPTSGFISTPPEVNCEVYDTEILQPKPLSGLLKVSRLDSGADIVSWLVAWTVTCYDANGNNLYYNSSRQAGTIGAGPGYEGASFPTADNAYTCTVAAYLNAALAGSEELHLDLEYTSLAPSPSPSPSPSAPQAQPITGYAGKCVDDSKNSRLKRAKVVLWKCQGADRAEQWTYAKSEFEHNGLCLNAKGNPANGSKVILWTCNDASSEIWVKSPNGSIALRAHDFTLCLTDPGYETKDGTQLVVSTCRGKPNQQWHMP